MAHAGKVLLKIIAGRLSDHCECENFLPEKHCRFRPQRSTVGMMFRGIFVVQGAPKKDSPLYLRFIDLTKSYDSVDRLLLWAVLARIDVPPRMLAVIRQFHDGIQACVRLDDGECLNKIDVGQGLRRGCVIAPLLFIMFFTAVLRSLMRPPWTTCYSYKKEGERAKEEQPTSGQSRWAEKRRWMRAKYSTCVLNADAQYFKDNL